MWHSLQFCKWFSGQFCVDTGGKIQSAAEIHELYAALCRLGNLNFHYPGRFSLLLAFPGITGKVVCERLSVESGH